MEVSVFRARKLLACSTFLVTEQAVLGRLAFWDVNEPPQRSLGILTALVEIQYALRQRKKFYYLGIYIRQNPRYQYKTRFPALELFDWDNDLWIDFKSPRINEMFNHRFRCRDDIEKRDPKFAVTLLECASQTHADIFASALVGSHAQDAPSDDSAFELIILTENQKAFYENNDWVNRFHRWRESKIENWEAGKILRAFYKNGDEYKFYFAPPSWADTELISEDTRRIFSGGMKILHDPHGVLERLQKAVLSA